MSSTLTDLLYHIVFSTKNRERYIKSSWQEDLYCYIGGITRREKGILLKIGGMSDHVHMLLKLKPTHSLSVLLRIIKSNSSKWVNNKGFMIQKFSWQEGYGAFTVSESQKNLVAQYIENQEMHHHKFSFNDELKVLLKRHQVEYDEKFLW